MAESAERDKLIMELRERLAKAEFFANNATKVGLCSLRELSEALTRAEAAEDEAARWREQYERAQANVAALHTFLEVEVLPRYVEMFDQIIGGESVVVERAKELLAMTAEVASDKPQPPEYRRLEDECC